MVTYLNLMTEQNDPSGTIRYDPKGTATDVWVQSFAVDFSEFIAEFDGSTILYAKYIMELEDDYGIYSYGYIGHVTSSSSDSSARLYKTFDCVETGVNPSYRFTLKSYKIYSIHDYFAKTTMISDAELYKGRVLRPVLLCYMDFYNTSTPDQEILRFNTTVHDLTYDSATWLGTGRFMSISPAEESTELQSYNLTVSLTGVQPTDVSKALAYKYRNRDFYCYLALLDSTYSIMESSVSMIFKGKMDNMTITQGKTGVISISVQNSFIDWERINGVYYSYESQTKMYSGDTCYEYLEQMINKDLSWDRN